MNLSGIPTSPSSHQLNPQMCIHSGSHLNIYLVHFFSNSLATKAVKICAPNDAALGRPELLLRAEPPLRRRAKSGGHFCPQIGGQKCPLVNVFHFGGHFCPQIRGQKCPPNLARIRKSVGRNAHPSVGRNAHPLRAKIPEDEQAKTHPMR